MSQTDIDALIAKDLAEARAFEPSYEVDRGAARFISALAGVGAAGAALGAAATAEAAAVATPLGTTFLLKLLGVATIAAVTVATSSSLPPVEAPDSTACAASAPVAPVSMPTATAEQSLAEPKVAAPAPTASSTARPTASAPKPSPSLPKAVRSDRGAAFAADVRELAEARDLLARDPLAALAVAEGAGDTAFREETDAVAIRALIRLGRREQAVAQAKRFVALYPKSPFAPTARALLEAR